MKSHATGVLSSPKRKGVLVVDDHPLIRYSIRDIINREHDLLVKGEAGDVRSALSLLEHEAFTLAIIDLFLGDSYGLELIKDARKLRPELMTIAFSFTEEQTHIDRVFHAGAHGFIHKSAAPDEFLRAVRVVLEGEIYLSEKFRNQLVANLAHPKSGSAQDQHDLLSDRELEVFELTGRGYTAKEIANKLNLDTHTVETYRTRIKEKFGLRGTAHLAAFAGQCVGENNSAIAPCVTPPHFHVNADWFSPPHLAIVESV